MTFRSTRREFLATASLAAVGSTVGSTVASRPLWAGSLDRWRVHPIGRAPTAAVALPEPTEADTLRTLAQHAIDAARSAGASYADVRMGETAHMYLMLSDVTPDVQLVSRFAYGVRVLVDGAWAFVHGSVPSADAVAKAARDAVTTARGYAAVANQRRALAPIGMPASGEWMSPMQVDPFTVPLRVHAEVMGALRDTAQRVRGASAVAYFQWTRELRVFASSDGAMQVQRTCRMLPQIEVRGGVRDSFVSIDLPGLSPVAAGFESVARPELQDTMKARAEEAVRLAGIPEVPVDVGRYMVIAEGKATASVLAATLAPALELDRVLGYEADAGGTSFLAPPLDVLGTTPFASVLSVSVDRAASYYSCTKWDDEGVEARTAPLIQQGRIIDYQTSRDTGPALSDWYTRNHQSGTPAGCVVASSPDHMPFVRASHLVVEPARTETSIDDLCRDVGRGVLVSSAYAFSDQQLKSAQLMFGLTFLIEGGRRTHRIRSAGSLLRTQPFWKSLTTIGGAATSDTFVTTTYKGQPWQDAPLCATAPACVFKDVDITEAGARLV